ncbi:MAG TPA: peptidase M4, partial [Blastocatellia bacterium]|nr:peptidase M4 [Blastocatellia bacterium]
MADSSKKSDISTPLATAAAAQTREDLPVEQSASPRTPCKGEGLAFTIGPGVERAVHGRPYERSGNDPVYRPLKIFTLDPAESRLEGSIAIVNVPYEPLKPG